MVTRVALYTRVSTEDQVKDGHSLGVQKRRLRLFAKAKGWKVAGEFVDEGHSGRNTNRPGYEAMMAAKDSWDTMLVVKMDRIHRNSRNFMAMMDQLRKEGKEFASVTESLDTSTAMGRFVMDIIQRIAQLESDQIQERVEEVFDDLQRDGNWHAGPPPYGLNSHRGQRSINRRQAAHVQWMADLARKGWHPQEITDALNHRRIQPPKGTRWTMNVVLKLLSNPEITGARIKGKHHRLDTHEKILSHKEFIQVHYALNATIPATVRRGTSKRVKDFQAFLALVNAKGPNKKSRKSSGLRKRATRP